jgi:hypothetical protein
MFEHLRDFQCLNYSSFIGGSCILLTYIFIISGKSCHLDAKYKVMQGRMWLLAEPYADLPCLEILCIILPLVFLKVFIESI